MSKKVKIIISILIATLLLTIGGTTVAMAQDEPEPTPPSGVEGLLARIARILGVTQEELVAAFKQARQEIKEEYLASGNFSATHNGTMRQERLNTLKEKWAEKQQKWAEKKQQWMEKKQQRMEKWQEKWTEREERILNRFQGNRMGNLENTRLQISSLHSSVVSR